MFRIVAFLVLCLLLTTSLVSAQESNTYVFVHGAFQNSTGWDEIRAALETEGHTTIAVELLGHGEDTTPVADITLAAYRDQVIEVIEAQESPVILVGHSFGGMVISEVAEAIPDRIDTLVYLSAFLPRNGDSLNSLQMINEYSKLTETNFILAEDFSTATIAEDEFLMLFCADCTEEQGAGVLAARQDEPLLPINEPATVTEENFGTVRKVYIMTARDNTVSAQLQATMLANTPVDKVFALDTSHAAYATMPDAVAAFLMDLE